MESELRAKLKTQIVIDTPEQFNKAIVSTTIFFPFLLSMAVKLLNTPTSKKDIILKVVKELDGFYGLLIKGSAEMTDDSEVKLEDIKEFVDLLRLRLLNIKTEAFYKFLEEIFYLMLEGKMIEGIKSKYRLSEFGMVIAFSNPYVVEKTIPLKTVESLYKRNMEYKVYFMLY